MGVSTNAILFYGYCWDEEIDLLEEARKKYDDDPEWPTIVALRRGHSDPWDNYPSFTPSMSYEEKKRKGDEWVEANRGAIDSWTKAKDDIEKEFVVDLNWHCSGECNALLVGFCSTSETRLS